MSQLEIVGVILSLLGVFFTSQQKIIAWYFNMAASMVYAYVFYKARLLADAELQVFFIVSAIYGLVRWSRLESKWKPSSINSKSVFFGILFCLGAGLAIGEIHQTFTSSVSYPYFDGILTAGSIWATYLAAQQKRENWLVWIVVDTLYVMMYCSKNLYLTAGLYGIFIFLAWRGWRKWKVEN